jgi:O-antigen/teichoic acid export membrane protein
VVIAVVQLHLARPSIDHDEDGRGLNIRETWRYGVGAIANTIMNRSDTVVVALALSATALGTYAVASQTENALTTLAMIPAGALVPHVARAGGGANSRAKTRTTLQVAVAIYLLLALPVAIAPTQFARVVFRIDLADPLPLRVCLVAGVVSVAGGILMQHLTGVGEARALVRIWTVTAVIAVIAMVCLSVLFGALGAAIGALVRDVTFFTLGLRAVQRAALKEVAHHG